VILIGEIITTALPFTNSSHHHVRLTTAHCSSPLAPPIVAFSNRASSSSRASKAPSLTPPSPWPATSLLLRISQSCHRDRGELLVLTAPSIWPPPVCNRRAAAHRAATSSSPLVSLLPPPCCHVS
jgi:hypothetical protein